MLQPSFAAVLLINLFILLLECAVGAVGPPVVDLAALLAAPRGSNDPAVLAAIQEIGGACRQWGFFQVVNHGISGGELAGLDAQMQAFFGSPLEFKNEIRRQQNNSRGFSDAELTKQLLDMKELFDVGHKPHPELGDAHPDNVVLDGFNQWPREDVLPQFRSSVEAFYGSSARLASALLAAMARDLGATSSFFDRFFDNHTSFLRLNYYPPLGPGAAVAGAEPLGISRHTDAGALTILMQDRRLAQGLEVYSGTKQDNADGQWTPVVPVAADALTVNVGDMIQVWSNNAYKAAEHRVRARGAGDAARFSAPFFFNPSYDSMVSPIVHAEEPSVAGAGGMDCHIAGGECLSGAAAAGGDPAAYRPISWADFRRRRFEGDFADSGREVQIEDYRIA